ncbi:hypothetical protein BGZ72_007870 [Mortierella alpina]|nr:hypothetical protein BGZ72_007870 [Mortierella alpina]
MILTKSLVILCSAALATARLFSHDAVATGALFLGDDISDPFADPADVFLDPNNHAIAASSLVVSLARKVRFGPSITSTECAASHYTEFKGGVFFSDAFGPVLFETGDLAFDGQDDLKQKVAEFYESNIPGGEAEAAKVADALANVVNDRLAKAPSDNWTFTTVIILQFETSVYFGLVELAVNAGSSFEQVNHLESRHHAKLTVELYPVDGDYLRENAYDLVWAVPKATIVDFIKYFTSHPLAINPRM